MICAFPAIYQDELIYSMIARYQNESGNVSIKSTTKDFFGDVKKSTFELPSNLDKFSKAISLFIDKDSDYFIDKHTLFPYFTAFLSEKDTRSIRNSMKKNQGQRIYAKTGLLATDVKLSKKIKFCHKCIEKSIKKNGEYYWNRLHQINEVYYCHIHKTPLIETQIEVRNGNRHEYYMEYDIYNKFLSNSNLFNEKETALYKRLIQMKFEKNSINIIRKHNLKLLESINFIMKNKIRKDLIFYKEQFINQMLIKNYITVNNTIIRKKLINDFINYYSEEYLKLLNCYPTDKDWSWLFDIVRLNKRKTHVIRYLLVAQFLGIDIRKIFVDKIKYEPFGGPKYKCLNKACDYFNEEVIEDVNIKYSYSAKKTVGVFKCPYCLMVYKKTCIKYGEKYNTKVIKYGDVWKHELNKLLKFDLSYREVARRLNCDVGTIIKYKKDGEL